MSPRVPIPPQMANLATAVSDTSEWLDKIFWDTQSYAAAGTALLDFFQTLPANLELGNMDLPGQIGGNRVFIIRALGVFLRTAIDADIEILSKHGLLRLFVGNKDYSEWPINLLPAGGGVYAHESSGVAAQLVNLASHGVPDPRAQYTLSRPLLIPAQLNFRVRCEWPNAPAISAQTFVTVMLKGELGRNIQ